LHRKALLCFGILGFAVIFIPRIFTRKEKGEVIPQELDSSLQRKLYLHRDNRYRLGDIECMNMDMSTKKCVTTQAMGITIDEEVSEHG
jgi:hypothetical protein